MAEVEGVEVILQVMFGDLIIQLRLPVMNLPMICRRSGDVRTALGEFGVEWCQVRASIMVSAKRRFIGGMVTFLAY